MTERMRVPVTVLNVTSMGASRSDAHIGIYSHPSTILDCSHWCLPGVPDAWNELVFSYLLTDGKFPGRAFICYLEFYSSAMVTTNKFVHACLMLHVFSMLVPVWHDSWTSFFSMKSGNWKFDR